MNVITLSKKKFASLPPLVLSKEVLSTEAILYDFTYQRQQKVLKRLFHQEGKEFANKLYTIEMLDFNKDYLPESFCIPESLVSVSSKIEGFILPKIEGLSLATVLQDRALDYQEQIYYLKQIGTILEQLKAIRKYTPLSTIYINDMHESNFMVNPNNKQVKVIDLDSCRIGQNFSAIARFLTPFSLSSKIEGKYKVDPEPENPGYMIADEQTDLYCYNMMVLNYLAGDNLDYRSLEYFYDYLNYLEYIGVDKELLDCFSAIVSNKPNENPSNYLDTLTRENVVRAKTLVYQKVKKTQERKK